MNGRVVAAEIAALVAIVIAVYAGVSLFVAGAGDGESVSLLSVIAVVVVPYALSRLLATRDLSERAMRWWGSGLSVVGLFLLLRSEIAGIDGLWDLGWLVDLLAEPGNSLEDEGAAITTVAFLGATWVWCVVRGTMSLTIDRVMTEAGAGLFVVLIAALFADAAEAPEALRWLPVPYMVAALASLALLHARPVEQGTSMLRSPWLIWTGGAIVGMALLALVLAILPVPSLEATGDALLSVARAIGIALAWTFSPVFFAIGWVFDHIPWPFDTSEFPEQQDQPLRDPEEEESEPSQWSLVLGYIVRTAIVLFLIALAAALIWFAFRRFTRRRDGADDETREDVAPVPGGMFGGLRSLLPRVPRFGSRASSRDAIGRLYLSMLRAASQRGLERPPAATPLEFAPSLDARFASPLPSTISRAYAEARYAAREPEQGEVDRLRNQWKNVVKRP
jgi:hypothetical protein